MGGGRGVCRAFTDCLKYTTRVCERISEILRLAGNCEVSRLDNLEHLKSTYC